MRDGFLIYKLDSLSQKRVAVSFVDKILRHRI